MSTVYKIAIVDDDQDQIATISEKINSLTDFEIIGVYEDTYQFLQEEKEVDILILDLVMPKINGLESLSLVLEKKPDLKVIINSMKEDIEVVISALKEGALGYIDKYNFNLYIEDALDSVTQDNPYMTPKITKKVFEYFSKLRTVSKKLTTREKDIVNGIVEGLSYKMIADCYDISIDTVRMNIKNIYKKFNINSKSELIKIFSAISVSFPRL